MGMFDSLYDADGTEWQTKAFSRNLDVYRVGDPIPSDTGSAYQVEVMRYTRREGATDAFATIRAGRLEAVPTERDDRLPLIDYYGGLAPTNRPDTWERDVAFIRGEQQAANTPQDAQNRPLTGSQDADGSQSHRDAIRPSDRNEAP
jgi:hypothetical protein